MARSRHADTDIDMQILTQNLKVCYNFQVLRTFRYIHPRYCTKFSCLYFSPFAFFEIFWHNLVAGLATGKLVWGSGVGVIHGAALALPTLKCSPNAELMISDLQPE